ncbi:hypothetical protein [Paraburkholderia kururiensis]|uniref:glycine-rich domain-containing protein n=1 Tax=Paraburkholderia kururiensis TaxID=984307 RepID=UPI001268EFC0|nr:hypothetical protein [Paraburkholderia kururiensis]
MKKLFTGLLALLLAGGALAQNYPSPTYNNLTVQGNATLGAHIAATGGTLSSVSITGGTISGLTSPLPVASGGTNSATASGTALDNITGFVSTGFLTRTGAGAYAFQSLTNGITYANLAQAAANTVLGNATGATANVTAITVTGCNGAAQALQWTNGSGFGCNSAIATSGANANITSLSGLTTPLSVAQGGTGRATLTAHGVLVGEGTAAVNQIAPSTAGQALISAGATSDPAWGYPTGTLIGVRVFTSSTTYTPTAGTNSIIVEIQGGGGAGGGQVATGAGQFSVSAGGAAGGYIRHRMTTGFSGATITIGAGGAGASGTTGGSGGASSFAGITANGGAGGTVSAAGSSAVIGPSTGGTATGGNILNINGAPGWYGMGGTYSLGGMGANSQLGSGGIENANIGGGAASGYGSGGGGGVNGASVAAMTGGAGAAGVVIVWEYN